MSEDSGRQQIGPPKEVLKFLSANRGPYGEAETKPNGGDSRQERTPKDRLNWYFPLVSALQALFPATWQAEAKRLRRIDRFLGSLFFVGFILVWSVPVTWIMGMWIVRTVDQHRWKDLPCVISRSEIEPYGRPRFLVVYEYEVEGRLHRSEQYMRSYVNSPSEEEAQALVEEYPAGSRHVCAVNPRDPDEAVLKREPLWPAPFVVFPAALTVVGLVGLWRSLGACLFYRTTAERDMEEEAREREILTP